MRHKPQQIGSLLYLTASRPDISYSVGVCARYQANPKESHMTALKRIIKYVKTTIDFGVWYSKDTNVVLVRYSNADWAGNADDRKSTSGVVFMWVTILSPRWAKSRTPSLYPLQKLSTSLSVAVALNSYGCKNSSMIMVFVKSISPSIVTIPVPSTSLRIRFNILEPNIWRFNIISLSSLSKMVFSLLSLFTLMIKRLTCSPNLLTASIF